MQIPLENDEHSSPGYQFQDKSYELDTDSLFLNDDQQISSCIHMIINQPFLELLKIIEKVAQDNKNSSFKIVYKTNEQIFLMNIPFKSLLTKIQQTICQLQHQTNIIWIKLENKQQLLIKALQGDSKLLEIMMKKLNNAIFQHSNDAQEGLQTYHLDDLQHDQESDSRLNPFFHNSTSTTLIYRICQEREKQIQTKMLSIMSETNLKKLMTQIFEFGEVLLEEFTKLSYLSKQQFISSYYQSTIEKYLFISNYDELILRYRQKFQEKQNLANQQKQKILTQLTQQEILVQLEIKKQFIAEFDPFQHCLDELEKTPHFHNPSEKLRCLQLVVVMIRSEIFECSQKDELIAMDDELPIIVFITLMSKIEDLYAQVQFIDDYISNDQAIENEKKILTHIRVSLDHIASEWKI